MNVLQVSPNPGPDEVVVPSDLAGLLAVAGYSFAVRQVGDDDSFGTPRLEIVVSRHQDSRGEPCYSRSYVLADVSAVDVFKRGGSASLKYRRKHFAKFANFQERFREAVMLLLAGELD